MYTSVVHTDQEALQALIALHAPTGVPVIADVTYSKGVMWKGMAYQPVLKSDINPVHDVIVADFNCLPYASDSIDVVVFDPPHLPQDAASPKSHWHKKHWGERYGITNDLARDRDNVNMLFPAALAEARRVLVEHGIALVKIVDIVHNHRYQWQHVAVITTAQSMGFTACDMVIRHRQVGPTSGRWKNQYHARRAHSYWICLRNSRRCKRPKA